MDVRGALKGQYHAALAMLKQAIDECPERMWVDRRKRIPFWRVVYHTLFYTHFYLGKDSKSLRPWQHHRDGAQHFDRPAVEPFTKEQLLDYWRFCDEWIDGAVDGMDLDAQTCGFPWYKLPKLDHQINNIRHIQHHTAILAARLRAAADVDVKWEAFGPKKG